MVVGGSGGGSSHSNDGNRGDECNPSRSDNHTNDTIKQDQCDPLMIAFHPYYFQFLLTAMGTDRGTANDDVDHVGDRPADRSFSIGGTTNAQGAHTETDDDPFEPIPLSNRIDHQNNNNNNNNVMHDGDLLFVTTPANTVRNHGGNNPNGTTGLQPHSWLDWISSSYAAISRAAEVAAAATTITTTTPTNIHNVTNHIHHDDNYRDMMEAQGNNYNDASTPTKNTSRSPSTSTSRSRLGPDSHHSDHPTNGVTEVCRNKRRKCTDAQEREESPSQMRIVTCQPRQQQQHQQQERQAKPRDQSFTTMKKSVRFANIVSIYRQLMPHEEEVDTVASTTADHNNNNNDDVNHTIEENKISINHDNPVNHETGAKPESQNDCNSWYRREDYWSFEQERRFTLMAIRNANGDESVLDPNQFSLRGLEQKVCRQQIAQRKWEAQLCQRAVLEHQFRLRQSGIWDPDQLKAISERYSQPAQQRALQTGVHYYQETGTPA